MTPPHRGGRSPGPVLRTCGRRRSQCGHCGARQTSTKLAKQTELNLTVRYCLTVYLQVPIHLFNDTGSHTISPMNGLRTVRLLPVLRASQQTSLTRPAHFVSSPQPFKVYSLLVNSNDQRSNIVAGRLIVLVVRSCGFARVTSIRAGFASTSTAEARCCPAYAHTHVPENDWAKMRTRTWMRGGGDIRAIVHRRTLGRLQTSSSGSRHTCRRPRASPVARR